MFHFPTFPPLTLCVQVRVTGHYSCRVSPFGNPRIKAWLTAPRGLSQPPTSFIGSWCQGIHRAPLITWPQRCSRPLCSSQGTGGAGHPPHREVVRACLLGDQHEAGRRSQSEAVGEPTPSGPNSVPRPTPAPPRRSEPENRPYWTKGGRPQPTGQCSTHEHRSGLNIRTRLWAFGNPNARCSLERR
jgi:hypothetical protein